MNKGQATLMLLLAVSLAVGTAAAMTVEEVIAKHVAAHGGTEALAAIQSMKITGQYQAFSQIAPFTLIRAAAIIRSASRREATPARASRLAMRSPLFA